MLRPVIGRWVDAHKKYIGYSDRSAILLSVYAAFSAAVIQGIWSRLPVRELAVLFAICAVLLALMLSGNPLSIIAIIGWIIVIGFSSVVP